MLTRSVNACPHCGAPFVSFDMETMTLVGHWRHDADHVHDNNCWSRRYHCASGHVTWLSVVRRCNDRSTKGPACDWVGTQTCFCHPDLNIDAWPTLVPTLPK